MLQNLLQRVAAGQDLSLDEMSGAIETMMVGQEPPELVGQFLLALRDKGETVDEIAGAALAMRRHMTHIPTDRTEFIDTCGTGGDGSQTFNISTAAAIVTAAAGVAVAKHGNRGVTSRSGSADVLAALGVNIAADLDCVTRCFAELGLCFCFAPLLHTSMKQVGVVRRQLGVPTIFNLLGPLSNPAGAPFQLLGVGKPHLRQKLAAALAALQTRRAVVVCGDDRLDEVTIAGPTHVTVAESGELRELTWTPSDFGLNTSPLDRLIVAGPEESAAVIRGVLAGKPGAARDIVVANAAAALWVARPSESLCQCAQAAAAAIDRGDAQQLLARLGEASHA